MRFMAFRKNSKIMRKYILLLFALFVANMVVGQNVSQTLAEVNRLLGKAEKAKTTISLNKSKSDFSIITKEGSITCNSKVPIEKIVDVEYFAFSSTSIKDRFTISLKTSGKYIDINCKQDRWMDDDIAIGFKYSNDAKAAKKHLEELIEELQKNNEAKSSINQAMAQAKQASAAKNDNTSTNSNDDFSFLVGTYEGYVLDVGKGKDLSKKYKIILQADKTLKVSVDLGGLWVENINSKVKPREANEIAYGKIYDFEILNDDDFMSFAFMFYHPEYKDVVKLEGVGLNLITKEGTGILQFDMNREGGNPKIETQSNRTNTEQGAVKYSGTINANTFGDFEITWFSDNGEGNFVYEHVKNGFSIKKSGSKYSIIESSKNSVFELEYEYSNGKKRLTKITKGNVFFNPATIESEKAGTSVANEEAFLKAVAKSLPALLKERYRPVGNYTFTFEEITKGTGILLVNDEGGAYVGEFKDNGFDGKGRAVYPTTISDGFFKNSKKQGHFKIVRDDGSTAEGKFVNNKREGLWKIKTEEGNTYDITYENGEKIKTVPTNLVKKPDNSGNKTATWGKENTQLIAYVKNATSQIKGYLQRRNEMVGISNRCNKQNDKTKDFLSTKLCLKSLKYKADALINGVLAAQSEMKKATQEAKQSGCSQTLSGLNKASKSLEAARLNFVNAWEQFNEIEFVQNTSALNSHLRGGADYLDKGMSSIEQYFKLISATPVCYGSSSSGTSGSAGSYSSGSGNVGIGFDLSGNSYSGFFRAGYPKTGSPARKAGIREGDRIFEIDGKTLGKHLSKYDVEQMLKGAAGTPVKIKFGQWDKPEQAKEYILYRGEGGDAHKVGAPPKSKVSSNSNANASATAAVNYPAFTGSYEGDNLLLLFGRKLEDPAVQTFLNNAGYDLKKSTMRQPVGIQKFHADGHQFSISFKLGILYRMDFYYSTIGGRRGHFEKPLPLEIPLSKSSATWKKTVYPWKVNKSEFSEEWTLNQYQLNFTVAGNPKTKTIGKVEIEAKNVNDWNSYYRQFGK